MEMFKVRVNPSQSKKLQLLMFKEGYKWNDSWIKDDTKPQRLYKKFLFFCSDKEITYCDNEYYFNNATEYKEIDVKELLNPTVKINIVQKFKPK